MKKKIIQKEPGTYHLDTTSILQSFSILSSSSIQRCGVSVAFLLHSWMASKMLASTKIFQYLSQHPHYSCPVAFSKTTNRLPMAATPVLSSATTRSLFVCSTGWVRNGCACSCGQVSSIALPQLRFSWHSTDSKPSICYSCHQPSISRLSGLPNTISWSFQASCI